MVPVPALTFRIFIQQLEFYAFHGATDEEQAIGHRYTMDIELRVLGNALESDDLDGTVDYGELASRAVNWATERQFRLVERAADHVLRSLMAAYPQVQIATLTLAKRLPPTPNICESAGVSLTLGRQDVG